MQDQDHLAAADSSGGSGSGQELQAAILNLPCTLPDWEGPKHTTRSVAEAAYQRGHRDALRAAAKLVAAIKKQPATEAG